MRSSTQPPLAATARTVQATHGRCVSGAAMVSCSSTTPTTLTCLPSTRSPTRVSGSRAAMLDQRVVRAAPYRQAAPATATMTNAPIQSNTRIC